MRNLEPETLEYFEHVKEKVAKFFFVDKGIIMKSPNRKPENIYPRQVFIWIVKLHASIGPALLGRYLGIDHSTILHSFNAVQMQRDIKSNHILRIASSKMLKDIQTLNDWKMEKGYNCVCDKCGTKIINQ